MGRARGPTLLPAWGNAQMHLKHPGGQKTFPICLKFKLNGRQNGPIFLFKKTLFKYHINPYICGLIVAH
jgi:hypothetical protein